MTGDGYAWHQLGRALGLASSDDAGAAARGASRAADWLHVITGMATGHIRVGSPTPVKGMPAWVTPRIVRGGFATGDAAAGDRLHDDELAWARAAGLSPRRDVLFAWFLSDDGLERLGRWLDEGTFRAELPEHTALLVVAWLLRTGRDDDARDVLATIQPWADRLRFWPVDDPEPLGEGVHVATVADAVATLEATRPSAQVEAQRRALGVWAPFTDELLTLWLRDDAPREASVVDPDWASEAAELVARHDTLLAQHGGGRRQTSPKENLPRLVVAMRRAADGTLDGPTLARARHAVATMVARHGAPYAPEHRQLRARQATVASQPSFAGLAHRTAEALRATGVTGAVADPLALAAGTPGEHLARTRSALRRATHAPVEQLVADGIIVSPEQLAEHSAQLVAAAVGRRHDDPVAGMLAERTWLAFQARRSVLLVDLAQQVRPTALPWFQALGTVEAQESDRDAGRELAALALRHFPGTLLPNPLVGKLRELWGPDAPLTFELAADIFTGHFSSTYRQAAQEASQVLRGSLYDRYHGIDREVVDTLDDDGPDTGWQGAASRARRSTGFARLARERAGVDDVRWYRVADSGRIIEQAQVLTTHNLAQVVLRGTPVEAGAAALGAWRATRRHLAHAHGAHALRHRKNAAYAWRQTLFFLSLATPDERAAFLADPPLDGLSERDRAIALQVVEGARAAERGERVVPFLGWVTDRAADPYPVPG